MGPADSFVDPAGGGASLEPGLAAGLRSDGYVRLDAAATRSLLAPASTHWADFADGWDDLGRDRFMADGGRYRRRRHAVFHVGQGDVIRQPHQPHYQSRDYNPLNGGVERWFEPILETEANRSVLQRVFETCDRVFSAAEAAPAAPAWRVEAHQFRVETAQGRLGRPTPEGRHRDGVDWVFVMLVRRRNVLEGVTEIGDADGRSLGRFTLAEPGDAVLLNDRRVMHGVTPIQPVDPGEPAFRDVLVVTFAARRAPSGSA